MSEREIMGRKVGPGEAEMILGGDTFAAFRNQLLICAVNRLGGRVVIPVPEVDGTGGWMMDMVIDPVTRTFTLETRKKQ